MELNQKPYKEHRITNPQTPLIIKQHQESINYPSHYHDYVEIIYVYKGSIVIEVNYRSIQVNEKELMIIGSNHIHSYPNADTNQEVGYYLLLVSWEHIQSFIKNKKSLEQLSPILLKQNLFIYKDAPDEITQIASIITEIHEEYIHNNEGNYLMITGYLYLMLTLSSRIHTNTLGDGIHTKQLLKENQFIKTLNNYVNSHYQNPIRLEDIALATGYSPYHFTRLMKKYTTFTFKQYLANFRVNMIKEALYEDQLSITEIAYNNGFSSIQSFNRCFKEVTNLSPTDYKKAISE